MRNAILTTAVLLLAVALPASAASTSLFQAADDALGTNLPTAIKTDAIEHFGATPEGAIVIWYDLPDGQAQQLTYTFQTPVLSAAPVTLIIDVPAGRPCHFDWVKINMDGEQLAGDATATLIGSFAGLAYEGTWKIDGDFFNSGANHRTGGWMSFGDNLLSFEPLAVDNGIVKSSALEQIESDASSAVADVTGVTGYYDVHLGDRFENAGKLAPSELSLFL